jgi:hypothetical protein
MLTVAGACWGYVTWDLRCGTRLCRRPSCGHAACACDLDKRRRPVDVPGLPRDGAPLSGRDRRVLAEVQWDSEWITVPEPVYDDRSTP